MYLLHSDVREVARVQLRLLGWIVLQYGVDGSCGSFHDPKPKHHSSMQQNYVDIKELFNSYQLILNAFLGIPGVNLKGGSAPCNLESSKLSRSRTPAASACSHDLRPICHGTWTGDNCKSKSRPNFDFVFTHAEIGEPQASRHCRVVNATSAGCTTPLLLACKRVAHDVTLCC